MVTSDYAGASRKNRARQSLPSWSRKTPSASAEKNWRRPDRRGIRQKVAEGTTARSLPESVAMVADALGFPVTKSPKPIGAKSRHGTRPDRIPHVEAGRPPASTKSPAAFRRPKNSSTWNAKCTRRQRSATPNPNRTSQYQPHIPVVHAT